MRRSRGSRFRQKERPYAKALILEGRHSAWFRNRTATGAEGMEGTEGYIVSLVRGRAPPDDAEKAGRCHRSVQLMSSAMGNQSQV